jgi:hypothetical protein
MDRDTFTSLPLRLALGILYDAMPKRLGEMKAPEILRPPKYDGRLSRGGKGYCWMSEMLLEDLQWWHGKKAESGASDSQYAEKDQKTAATLAMWIAWRALFPTDIWSGTRGQDRATGKPPSKEPAMHQWEQRNGTTAPAATGQAKPEDDDNF